ncbi:hypothetical protein SCHPADRAFT_1002699 [Schizopora paradoxa]|uniref:Peptidase S33 tripeptidyl aminopeptidase-like C-terminal domain-containing protein n=1 Tax=Schizopora paradoxa TaxID=27342 RepID=A0A0H2R379_9AGAM|nr:hypothetical protein SCHPADRAFT_1002699 [Schizopora paradoxa]
MVKTSSFAEVWGIHAACSIFAFKGLEGTFNHKTSHPLLLIGNTADPVTPLWAAHKMSKGFEGSVVLIQNSSGHASISGTSICTHKATESSIFGSGNLLDDIDKSSMTSEDIMLLEVAYILQRNYFVPAPAMTLSHVMKRMGRRN